MRNYFLFLLIFAVSVFDCFAAERALKSKDLNDSKRFALVIGNSNYESSPLVNPANDAKLMSEKLEEFDFSVTTLIDASQRQIKKSIDEFGRDIRKGGVGLFYFAGHGMQIDGRNYLIPVGAMVDSEQDVEYESVDVGRVLAKMEAAENSMNILILDACRNNPFARSFRSKTAGLATMDAPSGTFIAYATAPGSVASDGDGANGLFTEALVKALEKPDTVIEKIFKNARAIVLKKSDGQQVPWQSSSLTGDFYFNRNGFIDAQPDIQQTSVIKYQKSDKHRIAVMPGMTPGGYGCWSHYSKLWELLLDKMSDVEIALSACDLEYVPVGEEVKSSSKGFDDVWEKKGFFSSYKINKERLDQIARDYDVDYIATYNLEGTTWDDPELAVTLYMYKAFNKKVVRHDIEGFSWSEKGSYPTDFMTAFYYIIRGD